MKNNIREIIKYLRSLEPEMLNSRDSRQTVRKKIEEMGAEYLAAGAYSAAYRIGKFVIKVASQDLGELRGKTTHPLFKKYAPTVYWIHSTGKALICKFVHYAREESSKLHEKAEMRFRKLMDAAGFNPCDLHRGNLVRVGRRWCIIDYGCWVGN
jgi:hypothetical protein